MAHGNAQAQQNISHSQNNIDKANAEYSRGQQLPEGFGSLFESSFSDEYRAQVAEVMTLQQIAIAELPNGSSETSPVLYEERLKLRELTEAMTSWIRNHQYAVTAADFYDDIQEVLRVYRAADELCDDSDPQVVSAARTSKEYIEFVLDYDRSLEWYESLEQQSRIGAQRQFYKKRGDYNLTWAQNELQSAQYRVSERESADRRIAAAAIINREISALNGEIETTMIALAKQPLSEENATAFLDLRDELYEINREHGYDDDPPCSFEETPAELKRILRALQDMDVPSSPTGVNDESEYER